MISIANMVTFVPFRHLLLIIHCIAQMNEKLRNINYLFLAKTMQIINALETAQ